MRLFLRGIRALRIMWICLSEHQIQDGCSALMLKCRSEWSNSVRIIRIKEGWAVMSIPFLICDSPYQGANAGYHSRILKETEIACPGYYSAFLYDHKVEAELSATAHCGVQRYTFPEEEESRILIDLLFPSEYGFNVKDAKITKVDNSNIEGYAACESDSWSGWNDYNLYFVIKFSKPIKFHNQRR